MGAVPNHTFSSLFSCPSTAPPTPTKRESVTVIKQSVINKVPLRNNEASNAVGAIDGGLVKLMWFPTTPPLSEEVGVEKLLTQHS